ncbi:MAG: hypothetical protein AAGF01_32065 [Cyanobacteria bacterium P01_G01_bin.38]
MQSSEESSPGLSSEDRSSVDLGSQQLRAIAYSLDALIPGLYLWIGPLRLRLGGSLPEDNYAGTIHSSVGLAVVLPGYRIYSTYQGSYDPR